MWSKTKKKLESLTCDSLKDRVKFFTTQYKEADDGYGRACFVVDGKEKYNMCFYKHQVETWKITRELMSYPNYVPKYNSEYSASMEAKELAPQRGIYADWDFFDALDMYMHNPIKKSLNSDNEIIKSFALLDRRVGKRTLTKLQDTIASQTDMVKFFYNLRCEAEGLTVSISENGACFG